LDSLEREALITRGRKAKDVIENDAFQGAMNTVVNELFAQFLATGPEESVDREKLWATGQAVERLTRQLTTFVQTGAVEERHKAEDAKR
jgi:hypothetical protein